VIDVVIDLSHWNEVTDWAAIRASGVLGVIHKATQGTSYADPLYDSRKQAALDAGLLWGAYHFGECFNPRTQARHFLTTTDPDPTDLLVLDFEPCGDDTMAVQEAETFVREVWNETGHCPGLYMGQSFLDTCVAGVTWTQLQGCWLWIARYSTQAPEVPSLWPTWTMWQYTDSATVPGVNGACDRNQFNGDAAGLRRLWGVEPDVPRV
jgi:lysozyme